MSPIGIIGVGDTFTATWRNVWTQLMNQQRIVEHIGHRGAKRELPENTLPAFQRAFERGATAIELDVHGTRDGVIGVRGEGGKRACPLEGDRNALADGVQQVLRLPLELLEIRALGELLGCHTTSMLRASGPQAGQHGDSRAVISVSGVDSVLRADPRAPRAHGRNLAPAPGRSQAHATVAPGPMKLS